MSEVESTETQESTSTPQDDSSNPSGSSEGGGEWFWAEGVKGEGPRPDYLPEKYKTVEEAAKARSELEKKLGGFTGAPEEYEVEHLGLDPDQHLLKEIMNVGKEINMSQEGLDKLVGRVLDAQEAEESKSLEEEVSKLGDEGSQIMRQYKYFADNHLKPEENEVVKNWIKSADDLKVFAAMTKGIYSKPLPTENSTHLHNHHDTVEALDKEIADNIKRFETDETYRKNLRERRKWAMDKQSR